jgi:uncharacterized protein (DUF1499 family)
MAMAKAGAEGGAMAGMRDGVVRSALLVCLFIPVFFAYAALGSRFGLHDWRVGLGTLMRDVGPILLFGGFGVALLALGLSLLIKPRRGAITALVALLIPAAGIGYAGYVQQRAATIPPIHDISTNLADPPAFSAAVVAARAQTRCVNDLDFATKRVGGNSDPTCVMAGGEPGPLAIDLHRQGYSDIAPIVTPLEPAAAYARALTVAEAQGWAIGTRDEAGGVIEATATSFWFGFVDDIAIRVRPKAEGGSVVDVRSVSRVGVSDLGANAARIRAFEAAFEAP